MTLQEDFIEAFSPMPDRGLSYVLPYILEMVDEREMRLIVAMKVAGEDPITAERVASLLHIPHEEALSLLERSTIRGLVFKKDVEGETVYSASSFNAFLMFFARDNKRWDEFPLYVRRLLSEWHFRIGFEGRHIPRAEKMRKGEPVTRLHDEDILLLEEVLERVEAADDFAVYNCSCRRIAENCDFPTEACLGFNEEAEKIVEWGYGRRLTRDEARKLVIKLNKLGLIHQGIKNWRETGMWHVCACCACCCYPMRGGIGVDLKGTWPKSYYIAEYNPKTCSYCGLCTRRCQFGAWEQDGTTVEVNGKSMKRVVYDPEKCLGCGLCANTCPTGSITMKELEPSEEHARARFFPEHGKIFYD